MASPRVRRGPITACVAVARRAHSSPSWRAEPSPPPGRGHARRRHPPSPGRIPMPAPTSVSTGALVARDLSKAYADRVVLDGVDVVAHPGRALALVGENGSGKSTLLRLLAGLET